MVAEPRAFVDVEGAVKAWAKENVSSVAGRVYSATNEKAAYPQIVLFRIAGPDDACLIQFDVWGEDKHDRESAVEAMTELATAVEQMSRYRHEGVLLHGARFEDARWTPDEESGQARYIVEVTVTATSS
jgi:hypothetical protein